MGGWGAIEERIHSCHSSLCKSSLLLAASSVEPHSTENAMLRGQRLAVSMIHFQSITPSPSHSSESRAAWRYSSWSSSRTFNVRENGDRETFVREPMRCLRL